MKFFNFLTGAEAESQPWQDELKAGDCYIIEDSLITGVIDGEVFALTAPTVYGRILEFHPGVDGICDVFAYSILCPDGEPGVMCIVDPTRKITLPEFEARVKEIQARVK